MNRRAEHAYRIRLATLAKSADASITPANEDRLFNDFKDSAVAIGALVNGVAEVARTGRYPSGLSDPGISYLWEKVLRRGEEAGYQYIAKRFAIPLINRGAAWAKYVIQFKSIPKGKARALEQAAKVFLSARRAPRKMDVWAAKNAKNITFLLDAKNWPEKTDESPDKYKVGPFTVHNTLQLEGDDLAKTNKVIEAATKFVKSSGIPGAAKTLYGDVFVVGKLQGHNTLAWYNIRDDHVYLRPLLKANLDATYSLVHELGHRYWFKDLPREVQSKWRSYHMGQGYGFPDVKEQVKEVLDTIRVGEPLPIPITGFSRGGPPIVVEAEKVDGGRDMLFRFEIQRGSSKGKQGQVRASRLYEFLRKQEATKLSFPTAYASTSPEEHFAESFAMYAMKKLSGTHKEAFEKLIVNR